MIQQAFTIYPNYIWKALGALSHAFRAALTFVRKRSSRPKGVTQNKYPQIYGPGHYGIQLYVTD